MNIPFNKPYLVGDEKEKILDALCSLKHCGNHSYAQRCIALMKKKYGFGEVFLTPSCTAAMEMGALLCNLKSEDEVILPSYTFSSTANAIALRGAKPIFCEVDPTTMNIDVLRIEELITKRTKMIVPIDYAGIPCEIDIIMEIAKKHDIMVMQDAAQSFHSYHKSGQACGTVAPLAAFSFHETKNLSCGEGGALIVNDPALVEQAHILQEKGTDRSLVLKGVKNKYGWVSLGSSFLLADILAAMLLGQLEGVEEIVTKRSLVIKAYYNLFRPYEEQGYLLTPKPPSGVILNHHAFFVIFDTEINQQAFLQSLKNKSIYAYIGYTPLHSSEFGRKLGYCPADLAITEDIASRIVRLPFYTDLAENGLDYCVEGMRQSLETIYG